MCELCCKDPVDFTARVSIQLKGVKIGFKYGSTYTYCLIKKENSLRVGVSRCSDKDTYDIAKGEKVALEHAMLQYPMNAKFRFKIWQAYFAFRPIKSE